MCIDERVVYHVSRRATRGSLSDIPILLDVLSKNGSLDISSPNEKELRKGIRPANRFFDVLTIV